MQGFLLQLFLGLTVSTAAHGRWLQVSRPVSMPCLLFDYDQAGASCVSLPVFRPEIVRPARLPARPARVLASAQPPLCLMKRRLTRIRRQKITPFAYVLQPEIACNALQSCAQNHGCSLNLAQVQARVLARSPSFGRGRLLRCHIRSRPPARIRKAEQTHQQLQQGTTLSYGLLAAAALFADR